MSYGGFATKSLTLFLKQPDFSNLAAKLAALPMERRDGHGTNARSQITNASSGRVQVTLRGETRYVLESRLISAPYLRGFEVARR